MSIYQTDDLFDLTKTIAAPLLQQSTYPWQALSGIKQFILSLGPTLSLQQYHHPAPDIWIAKSAVVAPSASIQGPCIIDENAEIRHCAFIRGSAIVGKNAVVGNSTELKNCILSDNVQVPHFNYVGDSILGYKSHMGAGAITSNVKSDHSPVTIKCGDEQISTGLIKVGAMLGNYVEVGCNSVLNPGTIIGQGSSVYPTSNVRGVIPANSIYKAIGCISPKK